MQEWSCAQSAPFQTVPYPQAARSRRQSSDTEIFPQTPAILSGLPSVGATDGSYESELDTHVFEDQLVKQVQDIVSIRQQGE